MKQHIFAAAMLFAAASPAYADLSKEQCVDAHSRGQDARDQGKLTLARKLFLSCAVPACPALVQGDCARFADDLGKSQPTVSFAARDARGSDLPDTTVYVDDALVATRLDGEPFEIDPGKHVIRFTRGKDEQSLTIVVNTGEKGRAVVANFAGPEPVAPITPPTPVNPVVTPVTNPAPVKPLPPPEKTHPAASKAMIGVGAALVITGGVLAFTGYATLPDGCSLSDHTCKAPPGDPVYDDASSKVSRGNIGVILGGVGVAAIVGGAIWYVKGAHGEESSTPTGVAVAPWIAPAGGGFVVSGHM